MQGQKDPEQMEDDELPREIGRIETRLYFLRQRRKALFESLDKIRGGYIQFPGMLSRMLS
jgi:hypothetical protein